MAQLTPWLIQKFYAADGTTPLAGGKVFFYESGTSTKKDSYTTQVGDVAQTNPVILDANGEPTSGNVWLTGGGYKVVVAPADDTDPPVSPIKTIDKVDQSTDDSIGVIATIAALKALTEGEYTAVSVLGYYAAGDGGGGFFRWNASGDETSTNDGTTFAPTTTVDGGTWDRVETEPVDVKWFGAKGDNSNDDTAFITAAITWADAQARDMFLSDGTYKITGALTFTANVNLKASPGGSFIAASSQTVTINGGFEAGPHTVFGTNIDVVFAASVPAEALPEWWNVDGTADDVQIGEALSCGLLNTKLQPTTYTCDDQITVPKNVNLAGSGRDTTILNFNSAGGSFTNAACVYAAGDGLESLGVLSSNITKGDKEVTVGTPPSVSKDDLVVVHDSANSSYSAYRTTYHAGEMFVVEEDSSGSTIATEGKAYAAYTSASTVTVYKSTTTNSNFRDFTIKGINDNATSAYCLLVKWGRGNQIKNVKADDSDYHNVALDQCYNVVVDGIYSHMRQFDIETGLNYGLVIICCQNVMVTNCDLYGHRHAITTGGSSATGGVVCREINAHHNICKNFGSQGSVMGMDFHGNAEYCYYTNNITTGITLGGNHILCKDNIINAKANECIHLSEASGCDFTIDGNVMYNEGSPSASRGLFVTWGGGNSADFNSNITTGGTFSVINNSCYYTTADGDNIGMSIRNAGCTQTDIHVVIRNNTLKGTKTSRGHNYGISVTRTSGTNFREIQIVDNNLYGFGINVDDASFITVANNVTAFSGYEGIKVVGNNSGSNIAHCTVSDNKITSSYYTGIYIDGDNETDEVRSLMIQNNKVDNSAQADSGTAIYDTNLYVNFVKRAIVSGNIIGGQTATQDYRAYYNQVDDLYEYNNLWWGNESQDYNSITNHRRIDWDDDNTRHLVTGDFTVDDSLIVQTGVATSDGSGSEAHGAKYELSLTGANGDTTALTGMQLSSVITTQNNSESIGDVCQLRINEPAISKGATDTITAAASLIITGAPTEGTFNYAILVDSGTCSFGGLVYIKEVSAAGTNIGGRGQVWVKDDAPCILKYSNDATTDFNVCVNQVSTANTANPPTDAELDSAFGAPSTLSTGFVGLLDDAGGDANVYLCMTNGTSWWYQALTKAT